MEIWEYLNKRFWGKKYGCARLADTSVLLRPAAPCWFILLAGSGPSHPAEPRPPDEPRFPPHPLSYTSCWPCLLPRLTQHRVAPLLSIAFFFIPLPAETLLKLSPAVVELCRNYEYLVVKVFNEKYCSRSCMTSFEVREVWFAVPL